MKPNRTLAISCVALVVTTLGCSVAGSQTPGTPPTVVTSAPTSTPPVLHPLSGSGGGVIAFVSERDGSGEVFVMNADGSDPRQLTHTTQSLNIDHPDWSPDGEQIVYQARRGGARTSLLIMQVEDALRGVSGVKPRQLNTKLDSQRPAWSPDGAPIAFDAWSGRNTSICVVSPSGDDPQCWTETGVDADVFDPSWSPDGSGIVCAVHSHPRGEDLGWRLYILDVAGAELDPGGENLSRLVQVVDSEEDTPAWSPDGTQIAFSGVRDGQWDLFVTDAEGSELEQLTDTECDELHPSWSPDGRMLVFQANPHGQWDLYLINVDGRGMTRLTTDESNDCNPSWRPDSYAIP